MKKALALLLFLIAGQQVMAQLKLFGEVVDSTSSNPLPMCAIEYADQFVLADQEGKFVLKNLKKGQAYFIVHYLDSKYGFGFKINQDTSVTFRIGLAIEQIPTATIHGHKHESDEVTALKTSLTKGQLAKKGATSLGEALQGVNGVGFLRTGASIAKPVINGMHSNRLAIITAGSTLENQQWGTEHAPGLDPLNGGSLEVLKGATTLLYGNDAIGGVVRMIPGSFVEKQYDQLKIFSKFQSNPLALQLGAQYERFDSAIGWGNRITLNVKKAGDAYSPDYVLSNTGYSQLSANYYTHFHLGEHQFSVNMTSFNQLLGILASSHIGNQSDLKRALESDTPLIVRPYTFDIATPYQRVNHHTAQLIWEYQESVLGDLQVSLTQQKNSRDEFDNHGAAEDPALSLTLTTSQFRLMADKHLHDWRLEYGATGERQQNTFAGRYFIPNYLRYKSGAFAVSTLEKEGLLLEMGMRFDRFDYHTYRYMNDELQNDHFLFEGWSASVGLSKTIREQTRVTLSASRKYRAPMINELFSDGLHHGSAALEFGDLNLKKEIVHSITPSIHYKSSKWKWSIDPFVHLFKGFINLEPTGETQLSIRGAFPVFRYIQSDVIYSGVDAELSYKPSPRWTTGSQLNLVYATKQRGGAFIYGVPAPNTSLFLKHGFEPSSSLKDAYLQLNTNYVFRHEWADLDQDFTKPPEGYLLLGLEFGRYFKKMPAMMVFEINNILNQKYRDYMNRYRYFADEQGVQFSITFNYTINKK